MSKLTLLFDALDEEILTDSKKKYFIVIDRLDEDWVDDSTRYRLIRALIETMREVNSKIRFAKIIIVLRADLLDRVLRATTDSGFQDGKFTKGSILHNLGDKLFSRAVEALDLSLKNVRSQKDKLILHQICVRSEC